MNIFSKIFLTVLFCGVSLLLVALLVFDHTVEQELEQRISNQFQSIASLQRDRIEAILKKNIERIQLVSSRTQLRLSLQQYLHDGEPGQKSKILRILRDAQHSIASFQAISIISLTGKRLVTTATAQPALDSYPARLLASSKIVNSAETLVLAPNGNLQLLLGGPLLLDGKLLGILIIESDPRDLISTVLNHNGLQSTGETLLVRKLADGNRQLLLPTRFDPHAALTRILPSREFRQNDQQSRISLLRMNKDYRGKETLELWCPLTTNNWELIVKIDQDEAFASLANVRKVTSRATAILLCAGILASFFLARHITRPISALTTLTEKIAAGQYQLRADESGSDEIGKLGKSFNLMAKNLLGKQEELEEKVSQLETEINERIKAEQEIERLRGILPLCSYCKKVKDKKGEWQDVDLYIQEHSEADVSHSLCPACIQEHYPDLYRKMQNRSPGG